MKKLISFALIMAILCTFCTFNGTSISAASPTWDGSSASSFTGGGNGTEESPYQIATAEELKLFANIVNGADGQTKNTSACAVLKENIVLNEGDLNSYNGTDANSWIQWEPIGVYEDGYYFGTFDGNGHTVSGLYFNNGNDSDYAVCIGLFAGTNSKAKIMNVGVINSYIYGYCYVGGICGYNKGTLTNCHFSGTVESVDICCGGITGINEGIIIDCYNEGSVKGSGSVGGIAGNNNITIVSCYNSGAVTSTSACCGGVCGFNFQEVLDCFNVGTINGVKYVGGISGGGIPTNTVDNCYYLDTCGATDNMAASKTAEQFASGEVAWLLNGEKYLGDIHFYMANGKITQDDSQYIPKLEDGTYTLVKNRGVEINYSVEPTYTVTIPAEVTLGKSVTVAAENVVLDEDKQLEVDLTSTNGESNDFTVSNGISTTISYSVKNGNTTVAVGDNILTVNPTDASSGSTTLDFSKPTSKIKYSGNYTGTVTFTVSVKEKPIAFKIAFDYYSGETLDFKVKPGTTWADWVKSADNTFGLQSYVYNSDNDSKFVICPDSNGNFSDEAKFLISDATWDGEWNFERFPFVKPDSVIRNVTYVITPYNEIVY